MASAPTYARLFIFALVTTFASCKQDKVKPTPERPPETSGTSAKATALPARLPTTAHNAERWNPSLHWQTSESAIDRMAHSGRPAMIVVQGEWCPRCRELAPIFKDEEIASLAQSFEMVLVDTDSEEGERWRQTGTYVPRVLFLDRQGELNPDAKGPNPKYPHFFPAAAKAQLLAAMKAAVN